MAGGTAENHDILKRLCCLKHQMSDVFIFSSLKTIFDCALNFFIKKMHSY